MAYPSEVTEREAVLKAMRECDALGREGFLHRYGFGARTRYALVYRGRRYDPKAILAAAYFHQHGRMLGYGFNGGTQTNSRLELLGFEVLDERGPTRNPNWTTDELILALDLYLRDGLLDDSDQRVIELSETLNRLDLHHERPDAERFRNPNGVALKLANFRALDPSHPGAGMSRGGQRDRETWDRYASRPAELAALAAAIRDQAALTRADLGEDVSGSFPEGRVLERRHRSYERDPALRRKKVAAVKKSLGPLACEACGFNAQASYDLDELDCLECHHLRPLADGPRRTTLADVALLCANCHRAAHIIRPWPTVSDLRGRLTRDSLR